MNDINIPYTQVDGEPISSGVEKAARAFATVILIFGILISVYVIISSIVNYNDYKHGDEKEALWAYLIPQLCSAIFYFTIALFAFGALRVLANLSLTVKARAYVYNDDMGNEVPNNSHNDSYPQYSQNDYAPQGYEEYVPQVPQNNVPPQVPQDNVPPQVPQNDVPPQVPQNNLPPQVPENNVQSPMQNVAATPRLYICPICGNEVKDTMSRCPSCQTPLKFK